ncbi:MAG: DNA primase [Candidatus Omnitrophota bacterium]|nr:MAG: DNA primase [Candidatus Omnitrophota bacterium]
MAKFSAHILEEIQQRCNIVEIISGYIPLKKIGKNYKTVCPFHQEKTPSFMVNEEKQIFHCFGCGVGGNVFSFIMKIERLNFPEAVSFLAEKAGINIALNTKDEVSCSVVAALYKINELSSEYFFRNLAMSALAESARKYLSGRGLDVQGIKNFKIGFALNCWDGLLSFLRQHNLSDELILKSGLVISSSSKKLYDRFRNRIMFPISNRQGRIVGFGGRVFSKLSPHDNNIKQAKYINSPETEIYKKGNILYGFNFSKEFIQQLDYVVVVEGYLDFIVPFQAGFKNIVASLGTAFTLEQILVLKRYTKNVVIIFDADEAGQNATLRSLDVLLDAGMNVKIVRLNNEDDPDSYVRNYGREKFYQIVKQAKTLFDYKLEILFSKYSQDIPEEKALIAFEMLSTINKISDAVVRAAYITQLSEKLFVSEQVLLNELKKIKTSVIDNKNFLNTQIFNKHKTISSAEEMLVALLLNDLKMLEKVKKNLKYDDFKNPVIKEIMKYLFVDNVNAKNIAISLQRTDNSALNRFVCRILAEDFGIKDKGKSFTDCVRKIKKDSIQVKLDALQRQISMSSQDGANNLLREYSYLIKEQMSI